jgi:hypothetical protein
MVVHLVDRRWPEAVAGTGGAECPVVGLDR